MAAPQSRGDLLGMPAMAFANLNTQKLRPFAPPYTGHIGHAGLFEILPRHRRESCRSPGRPFVGSARARAGQTTVENRIVAVSDALDADGMFRSLAPRVVARVFAERAFRLIGFWIWRNKTFDDDFCRRRNQKIAGLAPNQLHRCALQ